MAKSDGAMTTEASTQAIRTIVMAPGVELDDDLAYALAQLRDRQERQLLAHQRTIVALRRATRVAPPPPPPDQPAPALIDVSKLPALVEWPEVGPFAEV